MGPNDLLKELVSSLHEESDALVAGDTERLSAIVQRKRTLLARLAPQLRQVGDGDGRLDRAQLRQAQRMNDVNGQLLSARMLSNGARLDALVQGASGQMLYEADGGISSAARPALARTAA
jgi:flagellar biosynthesis/type III secretory pathway chaperone